MNAIPNIIETAHIIACTYCWQTFAAAKCDEALPWQPQDIHFYNLTAFCILPHPTFPFASHSVLLLMFFTIFQLFKRQTHDIADLKMPSFLLISLTVFLTAWSATAAVNNGKCYHGNQIQDGTNVPCDPKAEVSSCCTPGFICLSNGLCEPSVNGSQYLTPYFSSTCTDYSWNSPSVCVGMCENNKTR